MVKFKWCLYKFTLDPKAKKQDANSCNHPSMSIPDINTAISSNNREFFND